MVFHAAFKFKSKVRKYQTRSLNQKKYLDIEDDTQISSMAMCMHVCAVVSAVTPLNLL